MRINANLMAVNTHRQLFGSQNNGATSMEKLSSGFRINRAADDAAGLAISEKMRSQIRGMKQASRNAQDGISVVQTAEGALDEVHNMLQRMKELAVQSASDSNQSLVDREALQKEVDALTTEINSITEKTQFNKMTLLDGSFADKHFHVGANANETIEITIKSMTAEGVGLTVGGDEKIKDGVGEANTNNVTPTAGTTNGKASIVITTAALADNKVEKGFDITLNLDGKKSKVTLERGMTKEEAEAAVENAVKASGATVQIAADTGAITIQAAANGVQTYSATKAEHTYKDVKFEGPNILTRKAANETLTSVQKSIEELASRRADLGAIQNRVKHTIKNLDNSHENLMSAESRVRHVDMALEIIENTRNNILQQASTSMLAQANQAPQTVLQLLR